MALWILRCAFLLAAVGVSFSIMRIPGFERLIDGRLWAFFVTVVIGALAVIGIDIAVPRKRLEVISCVYFGILVGVFLTYAVSLMLEPLLVDADLRPTAWRAVVQLLVGVVMCYACVSLLLQTKDDFRFLIPYVEFVKEVKGLKPFILDTSVIIDGRIADLAETNIMDSPLIMPRFVLAELQNIADSGDKLRRARGRRGLDVLNKLRNSKLVDLKIHDHEPAELNGHPVDMKLVLLAKHLGGKVVTGDYNLNKVARIQNVPVINLNDIANSLKPVFLPGEAVDVKIVKAGESPGQGVGYLDDGTMIVVEGGRDRIGQTVHIAVTSVLQTSAGRMIFGRVNTPQS